MAWAAAEIADAGYEDFLKRRRNRRWVRIAFWLFTVGLILHGLIAIPEGASSVPTVVALAVIMIAAIFHKSGIADRDGKHARALAHTVRSRVATALGLGKVVPNAEDFDLAQFRAVEILSKSGYLRCWNRVKGDLDGIEIELAEVDFVTEQRPTLVAKIGLPARQATWLTVWASAPRPDEQQKVELEAAAAGLNTSAETSLVPLGEPLASYGYQALVARHAKVELGDGVAEWLMNSNKSIPLPRLHLGRDAVFLAMPFVQEPAEIDFERRGKSPMDIAVPYFLRLRRVLTLAEAIAADYRA